jgi:mannosyltransferase
VRLAVLKRVIPTTSRAAEHIHLLGLVGAALVLTVLSLHDLGRYSFWRDEVASLLFAAAPLPDLLSIVGRNREVADVPFMATYSLLLHFWLGFAETEAQIRLLSVLAGVATTIPVYFVGRRLGGWPAGTLAAAVFATAPYVIEWNQEARSYSLAMFVSAILTLLLLRALERPTVLRWLIYGLVGAVGLYVHFFVGLVLAAHAGYVLVSRSWPPVAPLLAVAAPLGIAVLPLPYLVREYGSAYGWINPLSLGSIRNTLTALAGGTPMLVAMVTLGTVAVVSYRRDRRIWLILAAALVPILAAILISVVRPMLLSRYLVVSLPFMAILAGVGLAAVRPVVARAMAIGVLVVLVALALPSAYKDNHQQDWRSAGMWIAEGARPGDQVIVTPWGRRQLDYYLSRAEAGTVPAPTGIHAALEGEAPDRLWVVLTNLSGRESRRVMRSLGARFEPEETREFGAKVTVVLMTPTE